MTADNQAEYRIGGDPEPRRHAHGMPDSAPERNRCDHGTPLGRPGGCPECDKLSGAYRPAPEPKQTLDQRIDDLFKERMDYQAHELSRSEINALAERVAALERMEQDLERAHGVLRQRNEALEDFNKVIKATTDQHQQAISHAITRADEVEQRTRRLDRFTRDLEMRIAKQLRAANAEHKEATVDAALASTKPALAVPPLPQHARFRYFNRILGPVTGICVAQFDISHDDKPIWCDIATLPPRKLEECCALAISVIYSKQGIADPSYKQMNDWRKYLVTRLSTQSKGA